MAGGIKVEEKSGLDSGGQGNNDYEILIRNFISADKPHLPLPYNTITSHITIDTNLANLDQQNNYNLDENLIGTYAIGVLFRIVSTTNFMTKMNEGVRFSFYVGGLDAYFVVEILSSAFLQPVYDGSNYRLNYYYEPIVPLPLPSNPDCGVFNASGTNLAIYLTILALELS